MFRFRSSSVNLAYYKRNYASKTETYQPVDMSYITYETSGSDTPALIVMHGLLGSKANWNNVCKNLKKNTVPPRKIVAVDARNHGDSPHSENHSYEHLIEDLKALMRKLNLTKTSLMGHSMGGRAVMLFALKNPEMVEKVVVVDISPVSTGSEMLAAPSVLSVLQSVKMPENTSMANARKLVGTELSYSPICTDMRAFLLMNLVPKGTACFKWRVNIPALLNNFERYISTFPNVSGSTFDGPILFIGGATSDFIPKKDHPKIKTLFPNADFVYINGAGHWLHVKKPAEFLRICIRFLNR